MRGLTADLELALAQSLQLAADRKHEYATLEHLLLALTEDASASGTMAASNVDIEKLRSEITRYLDQDCAAFVVDDGREVHPTAAFQRVVQRAVLHVESSSRQEVSGGDVLISILAERDSQAFQFLSEQDMTRNDAVTYMSGRVVPMKPTLSNPVPAEFTQQGGPAFYLVRISRIETSASIGIHGFELTARQTLLVSVTLMLKPPPSGDTIDGVQDYDFVREGVLALVNARHFNLQETLCGEILDLCLRQPGVIGAVVQTNKPDVYPGVAEVACRMARMGPAVSGFPWWTLEL